MECIFEQRESPCFKTVYHNEKKTLIGVEAVVPEANGDIGQIAFVEADCYLKGKEYNGRGYTVTAQLDAAVFCLPESEDRLESLRLSREFEVEFEFPEAQEGLFSEISLAILNREARAVNPRKISLTCEIAVDLHCRERSAFPLEILPREDNGAALHILPCEEEARLCLASMEKQFTLQDQLVLREKAPEQAVLLGKTLRIRTDGAEQLGKRLIVKGSVELRTWTEAAGDMQPVLSSAAFPFTQILDLDEEIPCEFELNAQPTACYLDLSESIKGESVLDAEIHGVLQVNVYGSTKLKYAKDAYSNRYELELRKQRIPLSAGDTEMIRSLQAEDTFPLDDDLKLVAAVPTLAVGENECRCSYVFLLKNREGKLAVLRRSMQLTGDALQPGAAAGHTEIAESFVEESGGSLHCVLRAEQSIKIPNAAETESIVSVAWEENSRLSTETLPTYTLLITDGESIWELAKTYRSTPEEIERLNPDYHGDAQVRLLIPRAP